MILQLISQLFITLDHHILMNTYPHHHHLHLKLPFIKIVWIVSYYLSWNVFMFFWDLILTLSFVQFLEGRSLNYFGNFTTALLG